MATSGARIQIMQKCSNLQDLLSIASELSLTEPIPEINVECFPEQEQAAAQTILALLKDRRDMYLSNRQNQMMLLSDTDALGNTLVGIGMGDFSRPIADVQLSGLKSIRMGIEDMQQQLGKAHEESQHLIRELRNSEEKFRQLVETTSDWIWEIDRSGKFSYCSPQVEWILGYRADEILGRTPFALMPPKEAQKLRKEYARLKKTAAPIIELQHTNSHKDGREIVLESNAVPFFNEAGKIMGYRGVDRDITSRSRMEERLRYMASHDALTGLHNRQIFNDRVQYEINRATRYGHPLSAFLLDIDYFKKVNDNYGHGAGDDVLKGFSELLLSSLRGTDYIARYGGEEFTVLLPETGLQMALRRAEALKTAIEENQFRLSDGRSLQLTSSIGVATFPDNASDDESLLRAADQAMYQAKKSGRNRVVSAG